MSPTVNIDFKNGLQERFEDSLTPVGAVTSLVNWEPEQTGGLRVRPGWEKTSSSGILEDYVRGKGIGVYQTASIEDIPTIVQSVTGPDWDDSSSSYSISWNTEPTAGNTIFLCVQITQQDDNTAPTFSTPSGWTEAAKVTNTDVTNKPSLAAIYYKNNVAANQPTTLNLTFTKGGGTAFGRAYLVEVSGLAVDAIANPVRDKYATGKAVTSLGDAQATINRYIGGTAYELATSATANTVQGVEFGIAIAAGHREECDQSAAGSLIFQNYNYPYFVPLGNWQTVGQKFYGKQVSAKEAGNGSVVMAQYLLSIGAVKGTAAITNSDATPSGSNAVMAMATFRADTSIVTRVLRRYLVANDNGDGHSIYRSVGDSIGSATYALLGLVPSTGSGDQVAFASGLGVTMMTCARWTVTDQEGVRIWNGNGGLVRNDQIPTGRCIAFHKSRFFIGGSKLHPTRLHFSDVGDYATFGADNYIEVGQEDGEPIEDIAVHDNALLIAKQSSLWVLTGAGIDSFVLTRLPTGGGAPGRSICPTPQGAVVAGRTSVYLVGTDAVSIISDSVKETYGMTGSHIATTYADGVAYISDPGSGRTWCADMANGTWWTEKVSVSGVTPAAYLYNNSTLLAVPSQVATTNTGLVTWRLAPKGDRKRDYSPLTGEFEVTTPEMWLTGPTAKFTPRHLFLTLRQRGGNPTATGMKVTVYFDGEEANTVYLAPEESEGTFRRRIDLGTGHSVSSVKFKFTHSVPADEDILFDIEQVALEALVERVR